MGKTSRDSASDLTRQDILAYIRRHPEGVGKRELSRDLVVGAKKRNWLKSQLNDLIDEGAIAVNRGGVYVAQQTLPRVAVLQVTGTDADGEPLAVPINWKEDREPPLIYVNPPKTNRQAPGVGDRILGRLTRLDDNTYQADIIRRLEGGPKTVLGIFGEDRRIHPVLRGKRYEYDVAPKDTLSAEPGELVVAQLAPRKRLGLQRAKVVEILGKGDGPHAFSHIAIHMHGIPHTFPPEVLAEAEACAPAALDGRTDLREIPLVTIDGEDARDFDDAVFAEPWTEEGDGGWHLIVAIADVAWYVRPGSELDREALERGTSVYFPDRVIPMLPEALSNGWCSLKPGEDRPCLAAHLWIDRDGQLRNHKFQRGLMRSHARLTYEQVQAVRDQGQPPQDGALSPSVIENLFAAYDCLLAARKAREPLELVTSEPLIALDEAGHVTGMSVRPALESHQLIEEFMIAANVAAAIALEKAGENFLYRVHEDPPPDKVESFRDFTDSLGLKLPKGQVIRPKSFNLLLDRAKKDDMERMISEAILRCQSQARYTPEDLGHFGLALRRYCHFTSPIRRYPDLLVHRALIASLGLGTDGDTKAYDELQALGEELSDAERRAVNAERDTVSRFASAYLASKTGDELSGTITGVAKFGLFVSLDGIGAEGLVPMRQLPDDRYHVDEKRRLLKGRRSGAIFRSGESVDVVVVESNPINGSLTLGLGGTSSAQPKRRTPGVRKKRKGGKSGKKS